MRLAIFDALVDQGVIDRDQLEECRAVERETAQPLDRVLRQKGYVSEEKLLEVLSRALRLPLQSDLSEVDVPKDFVDKIPAHFARNYNLIGIGQHTHKVFCNILVFGLAKQLRRNHPEIGILRFQQDSHDL